MPAPVATLIRRICGARFSDIPNIPSLTSAEKKTTSSAPPIQRQAYTDWSFKTLAEDLDSRLNPEKL